MRFRKKPVMIEAEPFSPNHKLSAEFEGAVCRSFHQGMIEPPRPHIHTLEGPHYLLVEDWIIKGVKGEFYPCKPDIFMMTYEPVTPEEWAQQRMAQKAD